MLDLRSYSAEQRFLERRRRVRKLQEEEKKRRRWFVNVIIRQNEKPTHIKTSRMHLILGFLQ